MWTVNIIQKINKNKPNTVRVYEPEQIENEKERVSQIE